MNQEKIKCSWKKCEAKDPEIKYVAVETKDGLVESLYFCSTECASIYFNKKLGMEKRSKKMEKHRSKARSCTGYKGVVNHIENKRGDVIKYKAQIHYKRKTYYLGLSNDPAECAKMYDEAALKFHKEKAITNKMLGFI